MPSRAWVLGVAAAIAAAVSGAARADSVFSFAPTVLTAPDSRGFSNSTVTGLAAGTLSPLPPAQATYNFLDSWHFTVGSGAQVGAFVGSVNFTDPGNLVTQGIDNLQLKLVGPNGLNIIGWRSVQTYSGVQLVFSIAQPALFDAGDYTLQVRGLLVGPSSAYAGTLQAMSPVPLPATLPLLASGLGLLAGVARRRRG